MGNAVAKHVEALASHACDRFEMAGLGYSRLKSYKLDRENRWRVKDITVLVQSAVASWGRIQYNAELLPIWCHSDFVTDGLRRVRYKGSKPTLRK